MAKDLAGKPKIKRSVPDTKKSNSSGGRYHTRPEVREIIWIRAAGHCELCGTDLTQDFRVGVTMKWGEVAHILPASPKGPRSEGSHDDTQAQILTNDVSNLLLACPGCHGKIDRDADGYPKEDLSGLHQTFITRIRLAAKAPDSQKALALIFLSQHHLTRNDIRNVDLLAAMSAEGLTAIDHPIREILPAPSSSGRNKQYWTQVVDRIQHALEINLRRASSFYGDVPALAVAGLADIPALMMLGQAIGDRSTRYLFSPRRGHGLSWASLEATPPDFIFHPPEAGRGPLALVLSISGKVPRRDVLKALPDARIAEFTIPSPNTGMLKNRSIIEAFRDALQMRMSELEAESPDQIHVFPAIPAALAIEFGAVLTMQFKHPYLIYDRENENDFLPALQLGHYIKEKVS